MAVMHRLSYCKACGIFLGQGLNSCLLHWQADSLPLSHQGKPLAYYWYWQFTYKYLQINIHVHISLLCHLRGPRGNGNSVGISTPSTLILLLYMYFLATPCSFWDLSSSTRDWISSAVKVQSANHWTYRKFPWSCFLMPFSNKWNWGSFEKRVILGPREKIYKRHIEHPVFEQKNTQNITNQKPPRMGVCQRDTRVK